MKIGIDISQLAFYGTGVSEFLLNLVSNLLIIDKDNEYILFFSSLRRNIHPSYLEQFKKHKNVTIKHFRFPPILLDLLWNRLHKIPIERLIGDIDIFISSDWTAPPTIKAKKVTILYDLIIYKHPEETDKKIIATQRRRIRWVKKECDKIICISKSTLEDAVGMLGIERERLSLVYPGI